MNVNRIMIAAPKSGSGKTTITCALLQALKDRGKQVVSYKCGPDYIDPMFHEKVIGIPAKNLDTFFTDETQTKKLFLNDISKNDTVVIEGVMGLFDGLGGIREEGSSYHLAKVTKTPIVLVVDAKGMGRSVIALIAGFLTYDTEKLIRGVILNRISKEYYERIKPLIEETLKIFVFGFVPEQKNLQMESRHLGLVMPNEQETMKEKLQRLSKEFCKNVSVDSILKIAAHTEAFDIPQDTVNVLTMQLPVKEKPIIAVAYDEAFCFYYADNLRLLKEYGAVLTFFSPLHDKQPPKKYHALLIGGGYPELYARQLSENETMRTAIKYALSKGVPTVAECGGFMYLHTSLTNQEQNCYEMVGAISASCFYTGRLVRFGYIELEEKQNHFLPKGERIKGHEFHYYDSTDNGSDVLATKPVTGKTYSCMIETENCWLGFPHLYYPSNPAFAKSFVEKAKRKVWLSS